MQLWKLIEILKNEPLLPVIQPQQEVCAFNGYDADTLMSETAKLRKLITKRGTLEILIPLMLYYKSCKT